MDRDLTRAGRRWVYDPFSFTATERKFIRAPLQWFLQTVISLMHKTINKVVLKRRGGISHSYKDQRRKIQETCGRGGKDGVKSKQEELFIHESRRQQREREREGVYGSIEPQSIYVRSKLILVFGGRIW